MHIAVLSNQLDEAMAMDLARAYTGLGSSVEAERAEADRNVAEIHSLLLNLRRGNGPRAAAILSRALWHYKTSRLYAVPSPGRVG